LILVSIIAIFVFRTGGNTEPTNNMGVVSGGSDLSQDFMPAIVGVKNVSLDTTLLKSPIFQSLVSSNAYVDSSPEKGRPDPFSKIEKNTPKNMPINTQAAREVNLGAESVFVKISNITKTTATVSVSGIAENQVVSLVLLAKDGTLIPVDLSYKDGEYSGVATSLKSLTNYVARIQSPEIYSGLQADFTTK
jgi:hypothetical protein